MENVQRSIVATPAIQETRRQKDTHNENENAENNNTRASVNNEIMNDDVFHDLTQITDIPPAHSIGIITKNFEILSEHSKNNHAIKSIEETEESVPKSACTLTDETFVSKNCA